MFDANTNECMLQIETERLYIRQLTNADFDFISAIWTERCPSILINDQSALNDFLKGIWEDTQKPSVFTGLIFLRDSETFLGRVNLQSIDQEFPEVGIDLISAYRNQGYGPEALTGFLNWWYQTRNTVRAKVRIMSENTHSIHIFEKLGAEFIDEKPMFLEIIQRIRESLPRNEAQAVENIKVREYILSLPI